MRCCLVQPPLCDPSCPPLGLAYLSAVLEEQNVEHKIFDLNIDFVDFIEILASKSLSCQQKQTFNGDFQKIFESVDKIFPDLNIKPFMLDIPQAAGRISELNKIAIDPEGLIYRWIKEQDPVSEILTSNPDWIGISVSFFGQLPAALAIAAECKRISPATIILGGALFKDFEAWLGPNTPIWDYVNGVVVGAGEEILRSFFQARNGDVLPSIGRTDFPCGGWIAKSNQKVLPPKPYFEYFPLQRYKAAGLVLPYRVYSRCSWGHCTFCADAKYAAHLPAAGGRVEAVVAEIKELSEQYGANGIYFLDAELPARFMISYSHYLSCGQKELRWGANSRFSTVLANPSVTEKLYDSGCRLLRFGLESASPRILKLMKKGISQTLAEDVLSAVHQAGIATHLYLMRAFPGETEEDWQMTVDFLLHNALQIDMFNVSIFQLYYGAPLYKEVNLNLFRCTATQDRWVHPQMRLKKNFEPNFHQGLEYAFFKIRHETRCYPTTADTILLGEQYPIKYCKG